MVAYHSGQTVPEYKKLLEQSSVTTPNKDELIAMAEVAIALNNTFPEGTSLTPESLTSFTPLDTPSTPPTTSSHERK